MMENKEVNKDNELCLYRKNEIEQLRNEIFELNMHNKSKKTEILALGLAFSALLGLALIEQKDRDSRRKNRSLIDRIF